LTTLLTGAKGEDLRDKSVRITTYKGKRGAWFTLKTGRRVFIEEKNIKAYQKWTNSKKAIRWVSGVGSSIASVGVKSGAALALQCRTAFAKFGHRTLGSKLSKMGVAIAIAGAGVSLVTRYKREE